MLSPLNGLIASTPVLSPSFSSSPTSRPAARCASYLLRKRFDVLLQRRTFEQLVEQRMIRRQDHGRRTVDRVDSRGEHTNLLVAIPVLYLEVDIRAFTAAHPIALTFQNLVGPTGFDLFNVGDELFCIVRDAQEPLFQISLLDGRTAAPADPSRRLFVREHSLFFGTPVDLRGLLIGQILFEHLQEEPLVPLVIIRPVRSDLARPVVTDAETLQLPAHVRDVVFGPVAWIHATFDRGLFRRLAETVPADGMQHVEALQALEPRERITDGIVAHVSHVQETRRVRQHLEAVEFLARIVGFRLKSAGISPALLPLTFDLFRKVFFVHNVIQSYTSPY